MGKSMKVVSFALPPPLAERLQAAADEERRPRSNLARMILEDWLDEKYPLTPPTSET